MLTVDMNSTHRYPRLYILGDSVSGACPAVCSSNCTSHWFFYVILYETLELLLTSSCTGIS